MITTEYLKQALTYDPITGRMTWSYDRPASHFATSAAYKTYLKRDAGNEAGTRMKGGYRNIGIMGRSLLGHRIAYALHHNIEFEQLPAQIDHHDRGTANNSIDNLRAASANDNMHNRGMAINNTSGFKGVSWHKRVGKWQACIRLNRRRISLGYYADPEKAHQAYVNAANDLFGKFARPA